MKTNVFTKLIATVMLISLAAPAGQGQVPQADLDKMAQAVPDKPAVKPGKNRQLLVYSGMGGYAHGSVPWGAQAFRIMGEKSGAYTAVLSNDPAVFDQESLLKFDAVLFNNNCNGGIDDPQRRENLIEFVRGGGGLVGAHCAIHPFNWPEFVAMLGGYSISHPWTAGTTVTLKIEESDHPLTRCFDKPSFVHVDEIYEYARYAPHRQRVLIRIDPAKTNMNVPILRKDNDWGISWIRREGKGRVFFCALGHDNEVYWNPTVMAHYLAGIQWALGDLPADATPKTKTPHDPSAGPLEDDNLLAHYTCDEICSTGKYTPDRSGYNHHASVGNHELAPGKIGSALRFVGVERTLNCGVVNTIAPATAAFWLNTDELGPDQRLLVQLDGALEQAGSIRLDHARLEVWNGQEWQVLIDSGLRPAQWMHVAVVYDERGNATGYLNGAAQLTGKSGFDFWAARLGVGGRFLGQHGQAFTGLLDDVRIYGKALTPAEIKALGTAGVSEQR